MNLAKYGLRGKMGTGVPDDLKPIPKPPIVKSFHVIDVMTNKEAAIRYDFSEAYDLSDVSQDRFVMTKPIFRQFPIGEN